MEVTKKKKDGIRVNFAIRSPASSMATLSASYNLTGWILRPAPFNASKHGVLVEFSEGYSVAERVRPELEYEEGVVYTAQPVPVGELWMITVLRTMNAWSGGLVSRMGILCFLHCQSTRS